MLSRWETSATMHALMSPPPQPDGPASSSAWPFPPLPDDDQQVLDDAVAQLQAVCDATVDPFVSLPPLQDGSPDDSQMPGQMGLKRVRESVGVVQRAKEDALEAIRLLSETPERKQQKYLVESPSDMPLSGSPQRDNDELQAALVQMQMVLNAGYRHELEAVNALMQQNEVYCRQATEAQCRDQFCSGSPWVSCARA